MKIKSMFVLVCSIIFTMCLCSIAFASSAKTEAINFLKQATKNTVEAHNTAYAINLSTTGPLANCNIDLNGNYAYPVLTNGDMSLTLDLWIIDTTFKAQMQYYSEIEGDTYKQYFKTQTEPNLKNNSTEINANQWYVQTIKLPKDFNANYDEHVQKSIKEVADNIKNIFMYDTDDKTTKIYVTYKRPILDEDKLNEALNFTSANKEEMEKINEISKKIEENPKLKTDLTKPCELTYEITIDKENMVITSIQSDVSAVVQAFGTDILNNISDEELTMNDTPVSGETVRNIIKGYLERSKFTINIQLADFNKADVKSVPQEIKDNAIEPPKSPTKISEADDTTDLTIIEEVLEAVAIV